MIIISGNFFSALSNLIRSYIDASHEEEKRLAEQNRIKKERSVMRKNASTRRYGSKPPKNRMKILTSGKFFLMDGAHLEFLFNNEVLSKGRPKMYSNI